MGGPALAMLAMGGGGVNEEDIRGIICGSFCLLFFVSFMPLYNILLGEIEEEYKSESSYVSYALLGGLLLFEGFLSCTIANCIIRRIRNRENEVPLMQGFNNEIIQNLLDSINSQGGSSIINFVEVQIGQNQIQRIQEVVNEKYQRDGIVITVNYRDTFGIFTTLQNPAWQNRLPIIYTLLKKEHSYNQKKKKGGVPYFFLHQKILNYCTKEFLTV